MFTRSRKGEETEKEKISILNFCLLLTLTAPWCSLQQRISWLSLPALPPCARGHMHTKLSLPPLAKYRPSGDHFRPHTSCAWAVRVPMWWSATLTSWWWMCPDLEPLQGVVKEENTHLSAKMENTREISPPSLVGETFLPGDNMVIPAQTSNPCCVAGHAAQALLIFNIPQLNGNQYNL